MWPLGKANPPSMVRPSAGLSSVVQTPVRPGPTTASTASLRRPNSRHTALSAKARTTTDGGEPRDAARRTSHSVRGTQRIDNRVHPRIDRARGRGARVAQCEHGEHDHGNHDEHGHGTAQWAGHEQRQRVRWRRSSRPRIPVASAIERSNSRAASARTIPARPSDTSRRSAGGWPSSANQPSAASTVGFSTAHDGNSPTTTDWARSLVRRAHTSATSAK